MSQAGIINVAGGGGGGAPVQTLTGDTGGAVPPTANNIFVIGGDSIANNDNGILVAGNPGTSTLVFTLTNRISVTATTSDGAGQTQIVTLMTPTNATAVEFGASIVGYDAANDEAAGGSQEGIARKSAGVAVIVGTNDSLDESDPALNAADWDVIASGANLAIRFIGVAGRTIVWRCTFTYTQTP